MNDSKPNDPYHRLDYRRVIAWPARIEREWPFLERHLASAPDSSLLDLGCGTGEHAAFLAQHGFNVLGIDRSTAQIESAREYENPPQLRFLEAELTALDQVVTDRFGAAVCLGNVLPSLEDAELGAMLTQLERVLLPGGVLVVQILNYDRILDQNVRTLPINLREDEEAGGEIAFVRFLTRVDDEHICFRPTTLRIPEDDAPVEVRASRHIIVRAWRADPLQRMLVASGFGQIARFGSVTEDPFDPAASHDLVLVARRT